MIQEDVIGMYFIKTKIAYFVMNYRRSKKYANSLKITSLCPGFLVDASGIDLKPPIVVIRNEGLHSYPGWIKDYFSVIWQPPDKVNESSRP